MNTLQIHEIGFGILPETQKKEASFMEQKLKQEIQIGETIRSLRRERKLTQDQVVSKLQLMDLDITRSIYSQIEGGTYSIRISVLAGLSQIFQVDYNTLLFGMSISQVQNNSSPQIFPLSLRSDRGTYSPGFARNWHGFAIVPINFPVLQ